MARHVSLSVAVLVLLGACSAQSSPTPVQRDQEHLAFFERINLVVACVREHGFEATAYEGFGVRVRAAGEEQLDLASSIEGECWEEVEQRFPAPPPLSLEETYHYYLDVAECLRELSYDIPEAPSLDVYLDQAAAQGDMWNPYTELGAQADVEEFWELQRKCPPAVWAR